MEQDDSIHDQFIIQKEEGINIEELIEKVKQNKNDSEDTNDLNKKTID